MGRDELRNLIIQLLQAMSEGENILQCIKQALILHENFNPVVLFESLSREKLKITRNDLTRFLEDHQVQFSDSELRQYMANNNFQKEVPFNRFLDSIIPFNADALRAYKDNYLVKMAVCELDDEVEFIFRELIDNELKFARTLNEIKQQIVVNCRAGLTKVANLIKNDLIHKSKVREGRKFEERFESPNSELTFMDLRRFLELWKPTHEVMLLNLMRFLRSDHPLKPINLKLHDTLKKNRSVKSLSASKGHSQGKLDRNTSGKKPQERFGDELNLLSRSRQKPENARRDIYDQYKRRVEEQFENERYVEKELKKPTDPEKVRQVEQTEQVRKTRWKRDKKGVDGAYLKKLFDTIVTREERLEKLRKKLFKSKEFNLVNLFRLVDRKGIGIVNAEDIRDFINREYKSDLPSCQPLVMRFCREPGILRFQEFCEVFRPLSKQLNQTVNSRTENPLPNPFKNETNRLIGEIIRTTLEMQLELNGLRQRINDSGQDVRDLFRWVDLEEKGYVDQNDIKQLLEQQQFFCDSKDLKLLMRHLRKRVEQRVQLADLRKLLEL